MAPPELRSRRANPSTSFAVDPNEQPAPVAYVQVDDSGVRVHGREGVVQGADGRSRLPSHRKARRCRQRRRQLSRCSMGASRASRARRRRGATISRPRCSSWASLASCGSTSSRIPRPSCSTRSTSASAYEHVPDPADVGRFASFYVRRCRSPLADLVAATRVLFRCAPAARQADARLCRLGDRLRRALRV